MQCMQCWPRLQVPIYALNCWMALRFKDISLYFDVFRESYEAFVVYSFVKYLMTYLGSGSSVLKNPCTAQCGCRARY